jgi:membrane protease YdiL (CAAX protease family)
MSPEPPPPDIIAPSEPPPPEPPPPETYPFWGYLDLLAFLVITFLVLALESVLASAFLAVVHVKRLLVELPAQFILYGVMLGMLALIFRRYYGRPFWQSLRWVPTGLSASFLATCGILLAFGVMVASLLLKTPDIDSPMKQYLTDRTSVLLIAVFGTTLGPLCEELLFRGFLQPLLVRSLGAAPGILLTALPFGLLHLEEYGYSWRHGLLITLAGAAFGWMRHRTGSTKAAVMMHAAYNCVFFLLLAAQQGLSHGK